MYLRKHNGFELWPNAHPSVIECKEHPCGCKYHLVDSERTQMKSFDSWQEADAEFVRVSGAEPYNPFKQTV